MSITLDNLEEPTNGQEKSITKEDSLAINDTARRLYPQNIKANGLETAQENGLLPVSIGFEGEEESCFSVANPVFAHRPCSSFVGLLVSILVWPACSR